MGMIVVGLWLLIFAPLMCLPLLVQPGDGDQHLLHAAHRALIAAGCRARPG